MPRYPRSRLHIVSEAIPLERYTAPLRTAKVENANNVKTDAHIQLANTASDESVTDRVQPTLETVRVQRPINPHATVSAEQPNASAYPTAWADLDTELRRQQLLQANTKVRQLEDAARLGDEEQLRITLGRLLPGEDLPPTVLAALGNQYSPESKLLVALLTKLNTTRTTVADAQSYKPTTREVAVEHATEHLEAKADRRQEDPKAQAAADLQQAAEAEELKEASPALSSSSSVPPPAYASPVADLSLQMAQLDLSDDDADIPPPIVGGRLKARTKRPTAKTGKGVFSEPAAAPAASAQTKRWEEMRTKQPTLFRLTMKSQQKAAPLIKYMQEVGVPVPTLHRGPGRFPTEHLKQAVLDWHEQQLLQGEGISVDDDVLPQPYVKKVQKKTSAKRPSAKKAAAAPAAAPSTASESDDDESDADGLRWDIVTGEIAAGNNNPALLTEARAIARRAMKKGSLTAAQFAKLDARLRSQQTGAA